MSSKLQEKLAQLRALRDKVSELPQKEAPKKDKPRVRWCERRGKWVMRCYAVLAEHKPKPVTGLRRLVQEKPQAIGGICTHCHGNGEYHWVLKNQSGKCFRCNGKGTYAEIDDYYIQRRLRGGEPICRVASAC